ncbi:Detected protein of confused Function [Hibiscus syriacus]|uniref:Detected protein of confused Function n=1 Tax=Hibiscus syriacus TaxID=106335 RepID=A0A6A2ZGY0_HIBSY|nr:Detected protein of confused Function [Hibiscus syriacus]
MAAVNLIVLFNAITGDSVLLKFVKAKSALMIFLGVKDIVPQSIGCQVLILPFCALLIYLFGLEIIKELEETVFSLDPYEKQVGEEIIALLQNGRNFEECNDNSELESFHQAPCKLGITSSGAALAERSEVSDDTVSQGSAPCSPTVLGSLEDEGAGERSSYPWCPLESLDLNYWILALSASGAANSRSTDSVCSCNLKGTKVVPLEENVTKGSGRNEAEDESQPHRKKFPSSTCWIDIRKSYLS